MVAIVTELPVVCECLEKLLDAAIAKGGDA